MMWVVRAGKHSIYYDKFIFESKIFLPWNGYFTDFSTITQFGEFKAAILNEKGDTYRTSVPNLAEQLYSFVVRMGIDDYILIPSNGSRTYCLAQISTNYMFNEYDKDSLYHSRGISILLKNIPKDIFTQDILYSLGAYRTIFKAKYETIILADICKWKEDIAYTGKQVHK